MKPTSVILESLNMDLPQVHGDSASNPPPAAPVVGGVPSAARCLQVYEEVWGDLDGDNETTERGQEIIEELRAVASSPDVQEAVTFLASAWGWNSYERGDVERVARARALLTGVSDVATCPHCGRPL